ncbi:hypothetical protein [Rhodococcus qingshengii]|uniref:hypothetical protein n=1 Tax=Rhodococcus qingshengii TaxID=334542 RepID=UPI0035D60DD4
MLDTTDNTTATDTTAETVDTTATEATTTETAATETTATTEPKVYTQEYVESLRSEAANARVKGNEKAAAAATEAAEKARTELLEKLGKELGFIKGDEAPKPEDVIAQLTAERDETAQRETATAKKLRELIEKDALREAAKAHEGDFGSLADSKKLSAAIEALDHTADDYAAQVDAAVKAAITADPKLKAQAATTASSIEHGGTVTAPSDDIESFRKSRREDRGHTFN